MIKSWGASTAWIPVMLFTGVVHAQGAGAWYGGDADRLFWFTVVTDTHIGCQLTCGDDDTDRLKWATGEAFQVIKPVLMLNCGDLVDASNGGWIPKWQFDSEWESYRQIVTGNAMDPTRYVDMPGNHDAYSDKGVAHYIEYSVQGSHDGARQHSIIVDTDWGAYHFLAVSTPGESGAPFPFDKAGLDDGEMEFIEDAFAGAVDARMHFVFGHHGIEYGSSNKVGPGAEEMLALFKQYGVAAYFWGHTHDYLAEYHNGTLFFNTRSLGKSDDRNFTIAAVDHDYLAARAFTAGKWPMILVTAPADTDQGGGDQGAYQVPRGWSDAPVRALVFAKEEPQAVEFQVDGGPWSPMYVVRQSVFQGTFDATLLDEKKHALKVRAAPWGASHEITFEVESIACSDSIDNDGDGLTDYPDDPGCLNPADSDEYDPPAPAEQIPDEAEPVDSWDADAGPVDVPDPGTSETTHESWEGDSWVGEDATPGELVEDAGSEEAAAEHGTVDETGWTGGPETAGGDGGWTSGDAPSGPDVGPGGSDVRLQPPGSPGGGCAAGAGTGGLPWQAFVPLVLGMLFRRFGPGMPWSRKGREEKGRLR